MEGLSYVVLSKKDSDGPTLSNLHGYPELSLERMSVILAPSPRWALF